MNSPNQDSAHNSSQKPDRRQFVSASAAAATVGITGVPIGDVKPKSNGFHNSVDDRLKIGLVGCGGRGTQAVINALRADDNSEVTALADAFQDRIDICYEGLQENKVAAERLNVPKERQFTGFDCHEKLVNSEVDVVLLATPPYFRPAQMQAAVAANKHVFCEKPVAVDPPGVRTVMAACEEAKTKGLSVVTGLCYRYDIAVNAVMKQVLEEKAIGEIKAIQENYLTGTLWHRGDKPEWSQMENQMRNWLYYTWLSGDLILEQHIHSLDKAIWLMGDEPPETAVGTGGRLVRTNPKWGNVYDHFSTVYEWKNGVKMFSNCRQMADCLNDVNDYVIGTKGTARILSREISDGDKVVWKFKEKTPSMYDVEHQHLFRSIREGKPINDGKIMTQSTMLAIMGREACYTGRKIKWEELMQSETKLGPNELKFGDYTPAPVAMPGGDAW